MPQAQEPVGALNCQGAACYPWRWIFRGVAMGHDAKGFCVLELMLWVFTIMLVSYTVFLAKVHPRDTDAKQTFVANAWEARVAVAKNPTERAQLIFLRGKVMPCTLAYGRELPMDQWSKAVGGVEQSCAEETFGELAIHVDPVKTLLLLDRVGLGAAKP